ncbi:MAG: FAD-dependent oxidoreductase [Spirochaetota bacterium]|nr:FAD-dependent oxidoreductase [Spirochaetota bacterium]
MKRIATADILICGGGIIGLTITRELLKKGYENIVLIDKEEEIGLHASGRNSGVLHAGIYYTPDSLRARSCLRGNLLMKEYCRGKDLPLLESGKVIVAKNESEIAVLNELFYRAQENGARVKLIDERELKEIEPYARTCGIALFSEYTAVVDPKKILTSLYNDLTSSSIVKILLGIQFKHVKGDDIAVTNKGEIKFNMFINAGGAYSDIISYDFGVGLNYKLIPFKGIYKKLSNKKASSIKGNIYPVPDIRNPFLGVHYTKNVSGDVYIGPTAIPAFGRENYGIVKGIDIEAFEISLREACLFFTNPKFRKIALIEPKKYYPPFFYRDARSLVKGIEPEDIESTKKRGIRPQLVDWSQKELITDFMVLKDGNSVHILNAISPAFTSSLDFAKFVIEEYVQN